MHEDVASIYEQQKAIGYESEFIEGEKDCMNYMKDMFDDWQAKGITSILHEKKGGYAFNVDSIKALEKKSTSNGVNVFKEVKVTGFKRGSNSKAVTGVETDKGTIECEQVVVGAGPWVRDFWNMLELPKTANIKDKDGKMHETDMWTYWMLQEGVIGVDPDFLKKNNGEQPPVIHVDSTAPLYSDKTKKLLTDKGVTVRLTRNNEIDLDLPPRVSIANRTDADIFVSIHANASRGKRRDINGLETFYYTGWRGRLLAKKIQKQILKVSPGSPDRGVRQSRFFVIKNTRMPAVLVEIGFLTGRLDARRLEKSIHRERIAYAITKGILEYLSRTE